ncbi:MAG TPA: class I SAM-dependent methyltransferase [Acidimicrobiia bacterium]|nr:class I SAM-dependent methyltransferase [Acidimicrobiia bacterium]
MLGRLRSILEVLAAQMAITPVAADPYYRLQYRRMERMYLPALFRALAPLAPSRILEIGPGFGTTAYWLARRGHSVTVMDLMPLGTFLTQEGLEKIGCEFVHHDIEDSPAPEGVEVGRFDAVVMTQVIHHLAWRPDRALTHVAALLADDGRFFASVLDREAYPDVAAEFGDDWRAVPEWRTAPRSGAVVKCMYTAETFSDLLATRFEELRVSRPRGVVLAAATLRSGQGGASRVPAPESP